MTVNYGFYIVSDDERILYLTDFEFCEFNFQKLKPSVIMVEANYQAKYVDNGKANMEHIFLGHAELETCKDFIKANDNECLKQILLLHPSKGNLDKNEALAEIKAITDKPVCFAEKGIVIEV